MPTVWTLFSRIFILCTHESQEQVLIIVLSSQCSFTLVPVFTFSIILSIIHHSFPQFRVSPGMTVLLREADLPLTRAGRGQSSDGARHARRLRI